MSTMPMPTMTLSTLTVRVLVIAAQQATEPDGTPTLQKIAAENAAVIRERTPEKAAEVEQCLAVIKNDSQSTAIAEAMDKIFGWL